MWSTAQREWQTIKGCSVELCCFYVDWNATMVFVKNLNLKKTQKTFGLWFTWNSLRGLFWSSAQCSIINYQKIEWENEFCEKSEIGLRFTWCSLGRLFWGRIPRLIISKKWRENTKTQHGPKLKKKPKLHRHGFCQKYEVNFQTLIYLTLIQRTVLR